MKRLFALLLLTFLVGCPDDKPIPANPPVPVNNAGKVGLHNFAGKAQYEIPFASGPVNMWSFEHTVTMSLSSTSPLADGPIQEWNAQVIVVPLAGYPGDVFLCNTANLACTQNPAMGTIEGKPYAGYHPSNTPTIVIWTKHSDDDGKLRVTVGSTRKCKTPEYPGYNAQNGYGGILIVVKVPISETKATYYGGWLGAQSFLYAVNDINRARISWEPFQNETQAKYQFDVYYSKWQTQNAPKKPQRYSLLAAPLTPTNCCLAGYQDSDGDLWDDSVDVCPADSNKNISAGQCGCGFPDVDSDKDGVLDCFDACPSNSFSKDLPCVVFGDADKDGDVDMEDFAVFQLCIGVSPLSSFDCIRYDADHNGVVDDLPAFVQCASRAGIRSTCPN